MSEARKIKRQPRLAKSEIVWDSRYSQTMEDDKDGRWARIAYAGRIDGRWLYHGKHSVWEIAWIVKSEKRNRFIIKPYYPHNGIMDFGTLEEAKAEIEKSFRWFIKMCAGKIII